MARLKDQLGEHFDGEEFVFSHTGLRAIPLVAAVANIPMSAFILLLSFSYRATGEDAFINN